MIQTLPIEGTSIASAGLTATFPLVDPDGIVPARVRSDPSTGIETTPWSFN